MSVIGSVNWEVYQGQFLRSLPALTLGFSKAPMHVLAHACSSQYLSQHSRFQCLLIYKMDRLSGTCSALEKAYKWKTVETPSGLPICVRIRQHRVCSCGCPNGTESFPLEATAWDQDKNHFQVSGHTITQDDLLKKESFKDSREINHVYCNSSYAGVFPWKIVPMPCLDGKSDSQWICVLKACRGGWCFPNRESRMRAFLATLYYSCYSSFQGWLEDRGVLSGKTRQGGPETLISSSSFSVKCEWKFFHFFLSWFTLSESLESQAGAEKVYFRWASSQSCTLNEESSVLFQYRVSPFGKKKNLHPPDFCFIHLLWDEPGQNVRKRGYLHWIQTQVGDTESFILTESLGYVRLYAGL